MENIEKRILELRIKLELANYQYYVLERPEMDDVSFDLMMNELKQLEIDNPEFDDVNSPTHKVGGEVIDVFEKHQHNTPMLSLDNIFSLEEFDEFDMKIAKELGKPYSYVCEVKIDGLAMSLNYNHVLDVAATRGDGNIGENVTHNIRTIKSLPKRIKYDQLEVRGEVYISKKNFESINKTVEKPYANPRNLASGSVRQLDSKVAMERKLDMFCYGLVNPDKYGLKTYYESMMFLKDNKFKINTEIKLCKDKEEVKQYIMDLTTKRDELSYEIDGIVIKVNEYELQEKLGYSSKYPKWAIAYKFASLEAESVIEDIFLTVGRTGKITPNAKIVPIELMGSVISNATLHNYDYIKEKDIRINDKVVVIKAGDIIPRIERVSEKNSDVRNTPYILPSECPACGSTLEKILNDYFCTNEECSGKKKEKLAYFVSKNCMNIEGLSEKIISKLYDLKLIENYVDIYRLKYEDLEGIEGFKEKSINKLLISISKSLNSELYRFIAALGIKNIGIENAKSLTEQYETIAELYNVKYENLVMLNGFGSVMAQSVIDFFSDEINVQRIEDIERLGLTILSDTRNRKENIFTSKSVVITGSFKNYSRDEIKDIIENVYGGKVKSAISKNIDFLIVGEKAGSKLLKAQELGINLVDENRLKENIEVGEL